MNLIDTHAHLDGIEDVDAKLRQAAEAGVTRIIAPGVDLATSRVNLEIKKRCSSPDSIFLNEKFSGNRDVRISSEKNTKVNALAIFLAFGIHPGNIISEQVSETLGFIKEHKADIIAIGEIGLDLWYPWVKKSEEKKQEQKKVFQLQLDLAKELHLPVIVHSRGAWQECFDLVKSAGISKAVFHWYSGPIEVLKDILDSGYFISATPALAYSPQSQAAVAAAPIEQTLIETDSPVYYRTGKDEGFKASPKDVLLTLEAYAKLKNIDKEKAASIFYSNAERLFNL
jgi:TatD DNase family protein